MRRTGLLVSFAVVTGSLAIAQAQSASTPSRCFTHSAGAAQVGPAPKS